MKIIHSLEFYDFLELKKNVHFLDSLKKKTVVKSWPLKNGTISSEV
ncbi:hypothetical protein [Halobacillus sp. Marseille-P3879]|nr:hypothetical protein [Halobacillus sp. Marseille-P3879]